MKDLEYEIIFFFEVVQYSNWFLLFVSDKVFYLYIHIYLRYRLVHLRVHVVLIRLCCRWDWPVWYTYGTWYLSNYWFRLTLRWIWILVFRYYHFYHVYLYGLNYKDMVHIRNVYIFECCIEVLYLYCNSCRTLLFYNYQCKETNLYYIIYEVY